MAFQPINFIREPQGYGPGDLLGGLLQGYEASQRPRQMREEQEQRRAMIEQLLLGNQAQATKNKYLEPSLLQDIEKNKLGIELDKLNLGAKPIELQQEEARRKALIEQLTLGNRKSEFEVNHLNEDYELQKKINQAKLSEIFAKQNQASISEERKAYEKERGKKTAEYEAKINEELPGIHKAKDSYDFLNSIVDNPLLSDTTGPVYGNVKKYLGGDAAQTFIGQLDIATGPLVFSALGQFKGATNQAELDFALSTKPNRNDPTPIFKAKVKTAKLFHDIMLERLNMISNNINGGMNMHDAIQDAVAKTNTSQLVNQYKNFSKFTKLSNEDLLSKLKNPVVK